MSEPESAHERLRRAERELSKTYRYVVRPVEETEEAAAAVEDDAPLASLEVRAEPPPRSCAAEPTAREFE